MRYLGGKSKYVSRIVPHLVSHDADRYVEPFVGGASVLSIVARHFDEVVASDVMPDLIDMYQAIQQGWLPPHRHIAEQDYARLRSEPSSPLRTFVGFGCSFGGKWWGGYAFGGGRSHSMESRRSLIKSIQSGAFDSHVKFLAADAFSLQLPRNLSRTVIYCDPPYFGTVGYSGTESFDSVRFWTLCRQWAKRGADVYVSNRFGPSVCQVAEWHFGNHLKSSKVRTDKLFHIPARRK